MHIRKLSDEKILEIALKYGAQALQARQRFIGLLPEVNRRKLYEKKGCSTIVEFGAKFAGLRKKQVFRALNLERKFEDKPVLKSLFESGAVSMNKLVRVASIATKENEEILAVNAQLLSKSALEVFVRDERLAINALVEQNQTNIFESKNTSGGRCEAGGENNADSENQNGSTKPIFGVKSVPGHTLLIAEDVENELSKLQKKGIDINELLREFLQKRTEEIEAEKQRLSDLAWSRRSGIPQTAGQKAKKQQLQNQMAANDVAADGGSAPKKSSTEKQLAQNQPATNDVAADDGFAPKKSPAENAAPKKSAPKKPSKYVSVAVQNVQKQEFGNKCSIATCHNPIDHTHHGQRWGLAQVHDPKQMAPMCKQHHEIAHTLDLSYHKIRRRRRT